MIAQTRLLFAAGAAALAVIGAGAAVAQAQGEERRAAKAGAGLVKAAADYVGLSRRELVAELRKGQSLAQVAAARGKSRDGLEQALLAAAEQRLNERQIPEQRKQQLRSRLAQRIDRLVDRVWTFPRARATKGLLRVAAEYVGLTREQLRAELRAGRSLAQVATAQGKSVEGLKAALLDAVRARLERAENLSAERRARLLERAERRIDRLVNRVRS